MTMPYEALDLPHTPWTDTYFAKLPPTSQTAEQRYLLLVREHFGGRGHGIPYGTEIANFVLREAGAFAVSYYAPERRGDLQHRITYAGGREVWMTETDVAELTVAHIRECTDIAQ